MRLPLVCLIAVAAVAPCAAQDFPSALVTGANAVVCKDPDRLGDAYASHEKKDTRALRAAGCRVLRPGMQVRVEYAQRVGGESYHLIRVSWRRGPSSLWGYSYGFK